LRSRLKQNFKFTPLGELTALAPDPIAGGKWACCPLPKNPSPALGPWVPLPVRGKNFALSK